MGIHTQLLIALEYKTGTTLMLRKSSSKLSGKTLVKYVKYIIFLSLIKEIYLSKALTCMKCFLYKQKCFFFFIKEADTFGHIAVWTIYTSHIDHFTPQHTAFEQSTACLTVFLGSLPGLIPFAILWHAGLTLAKTSCMNMDYNYPTTIFRSIFAQNVRISGGKIYIYKFCLWTFQGQNEKL